MKGEDKVIIHKLFGPRGIVTTIVFSLSKIDIFQAELYVFFSCRATLECKHNYIQYLKDFFCPLDNKKLKIVLLSNDLVQNLQYCQLAQALLLNLLEPY